MRQHHVKKPVSVPSQRPAQLACFGTLPTTTLRPGCPRAPSISTVTFLGIIVDKGIGSGLTKYGSVDPNISGGSGDVLSGALGDPELIPGCCEIENRRVLSKDTSESKAFANDPVSRSRRLLRISAMVASSSPVAVIARDGGVCCGPPVAVMAAGEKLMSVEPSGCEVAAARDCCCARMRCSDRKRSS